MNAESILEHPPIALPEMMAECDGKTVSQSVFFDFEDAEDAKIVRERQNEPISSFEDFAKDLGL